VVKLVLVVLCLLWLVPTLGIVVTSFRTVDAANSSGWWTVITSPLDLTQYTIDNYRQAWTGGMADSFFNSVAVTLPAIVIPILLAGFAAYAFAFMQFPGRDLLFRSSWPCWWCPIRWPWPRCCASTATST